MVEEISKGQYYYGKTKNGEFIDKVSENDENKVEYFINKDSQEFYCTENILEEGYLRLATQDEINHLNLCIENNCYVEYDYKNQELEIEIW